MKSKQLANVLIKILGLSVCIHAIPLVVSGFMMGMFGFIVGGAESGEVIRILSSPIGAAVEAAVGIFLIVKSRKIAEFLFKNDDE